jgi:hypothetical protein
MPKRKVTKPGARQSSPQSRGRTEQPPRAELEKRYRALKTFFVGEWYRLGYALPHVQDPDDIIRVLNPVLQSHGNAILKEHMDLLLKKSNADPTSGSISVLRREFDEYYKLEQALYSEYLNKWRTLNEALAARASAKAELKTFARMVVPLIGAKKLKQEVDELGRKYVNSLERRREVQTLLQMEQATRQDT